MVVLDIQKAEKMVALIHWMNQKGWSPATSTNYSFLNSRSPFSIAISKSGVDKSLFQVSDFMMIKGDASPYPDFESFKSSAETFLHTVLYEENKAIEVILHTHSVYATILSDHYLSQGYLRLEGYEVLKGLPNIKTHEVAIDIPVFENTQDIKKLSEEFRTVYQNNPSICAYLIAGHGLYTWGKTMAEAKRHLEVLEFLLECEYRKMLL